MNGSYVLTKFNNLVNVTEIVTVHSYEFDPSFVFAGEQHDFWEIVYVDRGTVEITRDGEAIILKQGDILFHQPNEFHTIRSYNSAPSLLIVSFVCRSAPMSCFSHYTGPMNKRLKPFLSAIVAEAENTYLLPKNDPELKELVTRNTAAIGGEQMIKCYLEQFLVLMIRDITQHREIALFSSRENMETHLVSEIKGFLRERLTQRIRIEDICNTFGYSKTYLSQLFKKQCGVSLITYYNRKKIEYAKKLMAENTYSFTQISNMLAFDTPQYFARVFKRITGQTPSEFQGSQNFSPPTK